MNMWKKLLTRSRRVALSFPAEADHVTALLKIPQSFDTEHRETMSILTRKFPP